MCKVLIVDDDASLQRLLRLLLTANGMQVRTASDGAEALEVVEREQPDCMVLDLQMPRVPGDQVVEALRAKGTLVPTVILSANPQHAATLHADAVVAKPFDPDRLLQTLQRTLACYCSS